MRLKNNKQYNYCRFFNREGFTLAEILLAVITLGILSAILVPAVQKLIPDDNPIMYKKTYSELQTLISTLVGDETLYPTTLDSYAYTTSSGTRYIRGFDYTTTTGSTDKFCTNLVEKLNVVDETLNTTDPPACPPVAYTTNKLYRFARTTDGVDYYIYFTAGLPEFPVAFPLADPGTSFPTKIIVDVDGPRGVNCSTDNNAATLGITQCAANVSPDRFVFGIGYDGKIQISSGVDQDPTAKKVLLDPTNNKNPT